MLLYYDTYLFKKKEKWLNLKFVVAIMMMIKVNIITDFIFIIVKQTLLLFLIKKLEKVTKVKSVITCESSMGNIFIDVI